MVSIGAGVQDRLTAASTRCFGPGGESLIQSVSQQTFDRPLGEISYSEVPVLLQAVDRAARAQLGIEAASALAAALLQLQADVDAGFGGRLAGVLISRVGAASQPLLNGACDQLGLSPDTLHPSRLAEVVALIHSTAVSLFGADAAATLRDALLNVATARPAALTGEIHSLAREQLGEAGDALIDRICREQLEIALDDLDAGNVRTLAAAVERYGPALIGAALATSFVADASDALVSPAGSLRERILDLTRTVVGPLAPEFLDEVCREHGMPFVAVEDEHLLWLAETVRAEAEPLAGKGSADELARQLRALVRHGG